MKVPQIGLELYFCNAMSFIRQKPNFVTDYLSGTTFCQYAFVLRSKLIPYIVHLKAGHSITEPHAPKMKTASTSRPADSALGFPLLLHIFRLEVLQSSRCIFSQKHQRCLQTTRKSENKLKYELRIITAPSTRYSRLCN